MADFDKLAKVMRPHRKRQWTEEQKLQAGERLAKYQYTRVVEGRFSEHTGVGSTGAGVIRPSRQNRPYLGQVGDLNASATPATPMPASHSMRYRNSTNTEFLQSLPSRVRKVCAGRAIEKRYLARWQIVA